MEISEINNSINSLVHDIEIPLDINSNLADRTIYNLTKDDVVAAFSPEYLKFILADRRKVLYSIAVKHRKDGDLFCLNDTIYKMFNFIEIALALDIFPNLNSISFITDSLDSKGEGILTFTDDANPALNAKIRVCSFGIRLRDWFDEKTTDEINRQIFVCNEKFNNIMSRDNLILINQMNSLLDVCAGVYASMGKTAENSTMPLFDAIPKTMMQVPAFVFTDYLER